MAYPWSELQGVLYEHYIEGGRTDRFEQDAKYLADAYRSVEEYWRLALTEAPEVRLLILAEAPLYGESCAYFYNPAAGATSFFNYKDAEVIVGRIEESSHLRNGVRPRKQQMIKRLTAAGVVILDLFPFSLKEKLTALDYPSLAKSQAYIRLFSRTVDLHFIPKMRQLTLTKARPATVVFRYARLRDSLQGEVSRTLVAEGVIAGNDRIESIHMKRQLDRDKLIELYGEA